LTDRTGRYAPYAVGGLLVGSLATALVPHASAAASLLVLVAVFGAVSGFAFVAISAALAAAATPATRGLVMGGYSTALYLGLALGSFAFGPVITYGGYTAGFIAGGVAGTVGTIAAAFLWHTVTGFACAPGELHRSKKLGSPHSGPRSNEPGQVSTQSAAAAQAPERRRT
jgi:MFS family permease